MPYRVTLVLLIIFSLFGCGGGEHEPREEKTLYFIDAPVNGIEYRCGERQGVSKTIVVNGIEKHGAITCVYAPLELHLGNLELGVIEHFSDEQKIYPQDLVPSFDGNFNNEALLKIAILLQSLDDQQQSDRITIPLEWRQQISFQSLDNLSIEDLNQEIEKLGLTPVGKEEAKIHLMLHSENTNTGKPVVQPFASRLVLL